MRKKPRVFQPVSIAMIVGLLLTSCGSGDEPSDISQTTRRELAATPTPVVTTKIVTKTKSLPFDTVERQDPELEIGQTELRRDGETGTRTFTYELTLTDGVETSRVLVKKEVTAKPVNKLIAVGTYEPPIESEFEPQGNCDSNYSGCVPTDSDVDCAGGSGNGPSYFSGTVEVIGSDIYGLDADGDGVACE